MLYIVLLIAVTLVVLGFLIATWGGAIIGFVIGVLALVYVAIARRNDRSVGVVETGRRREPTGTTRSAGSGSETANERVEE